MKAYEFGDFTLYIAPEGELEGDAAILALAKAFCKSAGRAWPEGGSVCRGARGKPRLVGAPGGVYPSFSVSHSGALRCFALTFNGDIGVDAELERARDWRAIAARFYHPDEAEYALLNGQSAFFDVWCAKESLVKCTGSGIDDDFHRFSVISNNKLAAPEGFCLYPIASHLPEGCHGCVCIKPFIQNI